MIILNHEQGSDAWKQARLGRATGSNFDRIMTPKKFTPSKPGYLYQLEAERITGIKEEREWDSYYMARGRELEPVAVSSYEFSKSVVAQKVGFCLAYEKASFGCSPDRLIGEDGALEVQCPALKNHIKYFHQNKLPTDYCSQVYATLFVTQREWCDFMSYHPDYEDFIIRVFRDSEKYQEWAAHFKPVLEQFLKQLSSLVKRTKEEEEKEK